MASASVEMASLKRMRVPEIKDLCIKYGLSTVGKKEVLISRLREYEKNHPGATTFEDVREAQEAIDEAVEERHEEVGSSANQSEGNEDDEISPVGEKSANKESDRVKQDSGETDVQVVAVSPGKSDNGISTTTTTTVTNNASSLLDKDESTLSEIERRIQRKQRFNETLDEEEKRYLRSQRFGIVQSQQEKRVSKFGTTTKTTVTTTTVRTKRKLSEIEAEDEELAKKIKARQERFGMTTPTTIKGTGGVLKSAMTQLEERRKDGDTRSFAKTSS